MTLLVVNMVESTSCTPTAACFFPEPANYFRNPHRSVDYKTPAAF